MAYCSQSKRLLQPSFWALLCSALAPFGVVGCQSNAQQDLVARELRMQEDQIYAMEDYLAEYQKLICKYRMENAALRRQLGDEDSSTLPAPGRPSRSTNGSTPSADRPAGDAPAPKSTVPPPKQPLDLPDVPALDETTSIAADGVVPAVAIEPATSKRPIHRVWLHGEVVENDAGGGPRLIVEVEPRDATGQATQFAGRLSLMLLAPDGNDAPQSLARWDFSPAEVESAIDAAPDEGIIRFHLELPEGTPIVDSTRIWVRLLPRGGRKYLANAAINLREPGTFSSLPAPPQRPAPSERRQLANPERKNKPPSPPVAATNVDAEGWTVALPGVPGNLPEPSDESQGEWRVSTAPMPVVIKQSATARRSPRRDRPARHHEPVKSVTAEALKPAGWSPDRPNNLSTSRSVAEAPARPRWSATR